MLIPFLKYANGVTAGAAAQLAADIAAVPSVTLVGSTTPPTDGTYVATGQPYNGEFAFYCSARTSWRYWDGVNWIVAIGVTLTLAVAAKAAGNYWQL